MAEYIDNENLVADEASGFDFRKLWSMVVLNWYWFFFSTLFCVALAYVYLRYQHPVYQASTKVLIKDDENSARMGRGMALDQLGMVTNSNGFENEIEILRSTAVATRAVKSLKLYVTYSVKGRFVSGEYYKTSPILVDMDEARLAVLNVPVTVVMTKSSKGVHARISYPTEEAEPEVLERELTGFPCTVNTRLGQLLFSVNPGFEMDDKEITATITPPVMMGRAYSGRLRVEPTSKMTNVALLSIQDTQIDRAMDYLGKVVEAYNEDANEDKNEVARKTEEFIKERIQVIRGELDETEGEIEGFKRNNDLINLPTDASSALAQTTEFQKKQVEIQTQMNLVKSLLDYVNNPGNNYSVIPANIGITNQGTNTLIHEYNALVLRRNRLLSSAPAESPAVKQLTEQVMVTWDAVRQHLAGIYSDLQIQKNSADQQYALFSGKVSSTPTQERAMNNMGRQQEIKAGIYLMLLQKREENYISQASIAAKARVIDAPQFGGKVSPRSALIMLVAFILGLLLPLGILYLQDLLHYSINGREDLERLCKVSILADIPFTWELSEGERAIVVKENTNNMMEESFRGLRTNLRFVLGEGEKVIGFTSCVPTEGKTFVATNLGMSLALLGKRVLIIGLDIRKPRLVRLFGLPSTKQGLTNYLAANKPDFKLLEDQIIHGVMNQNLDVLPAGIIPPNPGELITREILDQGFEHLKTIYDYIIVDTPPVSLVSDTYELGRLFDVTFFVVRSEVTAKGDLETINRAASENKLPKVNLVLNGVDLSKKKYGFYYGYGRYGRYSKYGTYYGRYGHYGAYGHYGDTRQHLEK